MLFHSYAYFLLFGVSFGIYWRLSSTRSRTALLILASAIFYGSWNPWLLGVVILTVVLDYQLAIRMARSPEPRRRRRILFFSLLASVGLLGYFKYTDALLEGVWWVGSWTLQLPQRPFYEVVIPLGISFYTFETISYMADVYRGKVQPERRLSHYALFLLFFPHLIAGPIVRAGHFLPQISRPKRFSWPRLALGAHLFVRGLLKKAVIADQLAQIVDPVFGSSGSYATATLWMAAACYAVQVYCDFSGYSDMAIGSAHAFGFKLPVNFRRPYLAENIAEFWRRWHITLSTWLRDYVYLPLGGSRRGRWRTARNLVLTLTVAGIWHGAGFRFVVFGLIHGLWLAVHRAVPWPAWTGHALLRPVRIALTVTGFVLSLVVFRSSSLEESWTMLSRMLAPTAGLAASTEVLTLTTAVLLCLWVVHAVGESRAWRHASFRAAWPLAGAALGLGFVLTQLLMPDAGGAFIYFQF